MVPKSLQNEIYRTVKLRGPSVDETWAPWWDAQAKATVRVLRRCYKAESDIRRINAIEKREKEFVRKLKRKNVSRHVPR